MLTLPDHVLDRISPCPITGCWFYCGTWNSGNEYGKVKHEGETWMFHRLVFSLLEGPIPEGLILDHLCRVRWCCNPKHLEPVTVKINTHRGEAVLFGGRYGKSQCWSGDGARGYCLGGSEGEDRADGYGDIGHRLLRV